MNTELLKSKLLEAAIQGKLVPQDSNDEPVSVLLKRIHQEKAELIKVGKLKKEKPSESVNPEDVSFNLPEGWALCRLRDIALSMADGPFGSNLKKEHYTLNREVRIIQLSNIGENGWREENTKYTTYKHLKTISRSEVYAGDIVIAKMMPAGRAIICPDHETKFVLSSDAVRVQLSREVYSKYILNAINSLVVRNQIYADVHGVTRVRTSLSKLASYYIPLPPLAEQQRIVAALEEGFAAIDAIAEAKENLSTTAEMLRSKILQAAFDGSLTGADTSTWENKPLGELCTILNGFAFKSANYIEEGVRVIRITNVQDGYIADKDPKFYPAIDEIAKYMLNENDLLMSLTGNVGRVGLLPKSMLPAGLNQRVACLRMKDERYKPFLFLYFQSPVFKAHCGGSGTGIAQQNMSTEWLKKEIIPLPPLTEQQRIVAKIEELFAEIDKMI